MAHDILPGFNFGLSQPFEQVLPNLFPLFCEQRTMLDSERNSRLECWVYRSEAISSQENDPAIVL